ncbi:MAG TPA: indolepyruvate ferredoxin oxidoreductase family protein [Thermomicrobiaceae bacterium]|nr:indolepyruvate ferredoxin oxidoreductase family protein [Thermomicrobiaceae bacterium]
MTPAVPAALSLGARYTQAEGTVYLTGIQALVRLPIDQHLADLRRDLHTATFISGYRGSPLGGLDLALEREAALLRSHDIVFSSGLNEDLAVTAVFGSQMLHAFPGARYDGVLGMWYGKAPGVDRSGDALKHANYAGIGKNGGVLALAGDDPVCKSSSLPSHSEVALYDALIPTLYPGNPQEVLDFGLHGFLLSRASGLWTAMKIVTNVADGAGTVEVAPDRVDPTIPTVELDGRPFEPRISLMALPPYSLEMERTLHYARLELARRFAWENHLNRIVTPTKDAWLGILTAGKTYYDVKEALGDLGLDDAALEHHGIRILKLGMIWPVEPRVVREFARGLDEIFVVEEKRPFLETFTKEILYGGPDQPRIVGKADEDGQTLLPIHGELDADVIARAIARRVLRRLPLAPVEARLRELEGLKRRPIPIALNRTPYFCSGCPHNRSTVIPEGSIAAGGIGCHAMAFWMDRGITGATHMGAEGAQWIGLAPFTETPHLFQDIGDGTFFHSGKLALDYAVASGVNITYKILYNSAVAMTGGQDAAGALPVPALARQLAAGGVKKIVITTDEPGKYRGVALPEIAQVRDRDDLVEVQRELAAIPGVTVLIHDQQCAAEKRRLRKRDRQPTPAVRVVINERVCEGCGDCGQKSNCLSVQPIETEFGRKTQIHQSSCNQDYSCLLGRCPAFMTVEVKGGAAPKRRRLPVLDAELPEPVPAVPADGFTLHMMGIGGTGVVTVNQLLGTAAMLDGKHVQTLDQTGLSQKGGPVVSSVKLSSGESEVSNKTLAGQADLYLGFDLLVAATPANLETADPARTVAVVSTSQVPTGQMVTDPATRFPEIDRLVATINHETRQAGNVFLDAQALSEALFGDHMAANVLLMGAAYQAGALPISAASIEQAIRLNNVAVEMNLLAFQWGRLAVHDPGRVEVAVAAAASPAARSSAPPPQALRLIESAGVSGEVRRLLEVRVPDLIAYQSAGYARRYVDFVRRVAEVEQARTPGQTGITEAVARFLYKLMAYKDEYEVARLHLDPALDASLKEQFGRDAAIAWHLQPPTLERFARLKKTKFGGWFRPGLQTLRAMKGLRGTPLDIFGYTEIRRLERELITEYRELVETALPKLTPANHATVVAIAGLPDLVRGYEEVKLANVRRYREEAARLLAALDQPAAPAEEPVPAVR